MDSQSSFIMFRYRSYQFYLQLVSSLYHKVPYRRHLLVDAMMKWHFGNDSSPTPFAFRLKNSSALTNPISAGAWVSKSIFGNIKSVISILQPSISLFLRSKAENDLSQWLIKSEWSKVIHYELHFDSSDFIGGSFLPNLRWRHIRRDESLKLPSAM